MNKVKKYTKEIISVAVINSNSWAGACRFLNTKPRGGSQSYIAKLAKSFNIDYSHFLGQAHNKGKSWVVVDVNKFLHKGSVINSHRLKIYLFREKIKEERCEICKMTHWMDEPLVFELDHKDSDHTNNELINLQILCPNCHALETRKRLAERMKNKPEKIIIKKQRPEKKIKIKKGRIGTRKVIRPNIEDLMLEIENNSYCWAGRKYGVSDNAIRKWIKLYKRDLAINEKVKL